MPQPGTPQLTPTPKDLRNLQDLYRTSVHSFYRGGLAQAQSAPADTFGKKLSAFMSSNMWSWIGNYLRLRFHSKHKFLDYTHSPADSGVYELRDDSLIGGPPDPAGEFRVSLAGDWGTGTNESSQVAAHIASFSPHYTIHLGDVYYVGGSEEVNENCLGVPDQKDPTPVLWPVGSVGSFALNGNHEMYADGAGYFDHFLPKLGLRQAPGQPPTGQLASFMCLQNAHWLILGLDTGYNSVSLPLLELVFEPSCKFEDPLLSWLEKNVLPLAARRGIILLTHHQYFSAFDHWYTKPAKQLADLFNKHNLTKPVLWFWGHEHRLAVYGKYQTDGGISAYGRCIGHGGMPVDISKSPADTRPPLVLSDQRTYPPYAADHLGYNGFANLVFRGDTLTVEYRDVDNSSLLKETWQVDPQGQLRAAGIQRLDKALPSQLTQHDPNLNRAQG